MNQEAQHFGDLEYLNTINIQYSEILFNVTTRGLKKLFPSELIMDVRFGRSTFHHFEIISLVLRIVNEHESSFHLPSSAQLPSVMDCNDGRSIQIISFEFIQYFRLLLIRIYRMHNHLM